jgi:cation:H+ antiporter
LVRGASRLALSLWHFAPGSGAHGGGLWHQCAPEVAVSVGAVLDGKTDLALGNVVGSNIFNVLFILGLSCA